MFASLQHGTKLQKLTHEVEKELRPIFQQVEKQIDEHQFRMLESFRKQGVSEYHLQSSTGYGYDDIGRDTLEKIYADLFDAEMALVRPNIVAGTHAIAACLYGVLRPGDEFVYLTGKPYDTLLKVIGSPGDGTGSLADLGISYREAELTQDNQVNWNLFEQLLTPKTKLVCIQRSRGYASRPSFQIEEIQEMIRRIKSYRSDLVVFVDNCYGEFVENQEPTAVGADLVAGSLIKNPGGGIAKSGGYIIGKKQWVEKAAARLVAPGIGVEGGATHGYLRDYFQGLFLAPHVVGQALKGAIFASAILERLGFVTTPRWSDPRTDIIQQVSLGTADRLIAFCRGIQAASPVDAHISPEPAAMPGYEDEVIMAAGTFVQGASIELSADGPLREPFIVYLQGGLTYSHAKIAILMAVDQMLSQP
ncbi:methionine gamma-lyase family protein [Risungbinella massiliensis]|uniref:methionine gamma-lyase family protein n=1 Tax=Risungbinella massiliensis TaxID=1329796 RepID=UPI0005CBFEE8|nr:methionine gamma-lyase family protein [Risungbinella massiliensis]